MIALPFRRSLTFAFLAAVALAALPSIVSAQSVPPDGFSSLFNGKDLAGWFGWGTRDPRELLAMTPEALAEYKKLSVEGGGPTGKQGPDKINAHWRVENGAI